MEALGCAVVVVAQGLRESGLQWKKDYGLQFPLLIDRDMRFYRQFGLRRRLKLVWNLEIFTFYAARVVEGGKDNMVYPGDDLTLMGGDFIVRRNGEVIFAHAQTSQFDRPQISDLKNCLKQ